MALGLAKTLLLLQLSLLFIGSFAANFDDDLISSLPPIPSAPADPPSHSPLQKAVAVQGYVYWRSCNHSTWSVSPVPGATVQMQCNITATPETFQVQTDDKGYFFLQGPQSATIYDAYKCNVALGPCPGDWCKRPSPFRSGASGVPLKNPRIFRSFYLFSVGPWAYEPNCP